MKLFDFTKILLFIFAILQISVAYRTYTPRNENLTLPINAYAYAVDADAAFDDIEFILLQDNQTSLHKETAGALLVSEHADSSNLQRVKRKDGQENGTTVSDVANITEQVHELPSVTDHASNPLQDHNAIIMGVSNENPTPIPLRNLVTLGNFNVIYENNTLIVNYLNGTTKHYQLNQNDNPINLIRVIMDEILVEKGLPTMPDERTDPDAMRVAKDIQREEKPTLSERGATIESNGSSDNPKNITV